MIELRIKKRWSYAAIAEYLNKKKIPYRKGKSWDGHKVSYICSVNAKTYAQGRSSVSFQGRKYDYTFPPLISKSELLQLEGISPDFIIKGRRRIQYLLSGKLVCGICGTRIQHHKIYGRCNGKKKVYEYYTCRNKLDPANGERCKLPSVPQEWLEWWIWHHLAGLFEDQKHFEQVLFSANAQFKKDNRRVDELATKIMQIDEVLKDTATQIENVIDFIAEGSIAHKAATKKIENLQKQEAKLKEARQKLEVEQSLLLREASTMEKIKETCLWWLEYMEKLDENSKRKLVDALIERIEISPRKYTKAQAERDDKYGGGPEAGFGTKVSLNIIGRVKLIGDKRYGKSQSWDYWVAV